MSVVSVRLANSLHEKLRVLAKTDGISLNQFINLALVEKTAKIEADHWWKERGGDVTKNDMKNALKKISKGKLDKKDKI